jgi:hypothetical protein
MRILRRVVLWGFAAMTAGALGLAQVDTVASSQQKASNPDSATSERQDQIPGFGGRVLMFGVVIVMFGGLGWILDAKRRIVDREANL